MYLGVGSSPINCTIKNSRESGIFQENQGFAAVFNVFLFSNLNVSLASLKSFFVQYFVQFFMRIKRSEVFLRFLFLHVLPFLS